MPLGPLKSPRGFRALAGAFIGMTATIGLLVLLVGVNLFQTMSLVLYPFSRQTFRAFNRMCAGSWWSLCVALGGRINRTTIHYTGDNVLDRENSIIVANHQQMPDILLLMALARSKKCLGDLKFFVKDILKWAPGVGWGMLFIDCIFIKRNWTSDQDSITKTFAKIVDEDIPLWLVSFVEGTRIKPRKLKASQEYAIKNGLKANQHLLLPRSKGFAASVTGLRDHIDAVYDITIGYEVGVPTLWQWVKGYVDNAHVHIRRFPADQLPINDDDLRLWLLHRFQEKDRLLGHYYKTGTFPAEALPAEMLITTGQIREAFNAPR